MRGDSFCIAILCLLMIGSCVHDRHSVEPVCQYAGCIRLDDIHGLWGGYAIAIQDDGTTYVREVKVEHGRKERRFRTKLSVTEAADLKQFIVDAGYFGFREKSRFGVPDEARPHIWACFDGQCLHSAKWAEDKNKRFDLVYDRLLDLAIEIAKQRPIWAGKHDASSVWPSFLKTN